MLWEMYGAMVFCPLSMEAGKTFPWSHMADFIGVLLTDFSMMNSEGIILMSIKESTRTKAVVIVSEALQSDSMIPHSVVALCGKLRWVVWAVLALRLRER